MVSEESAPEPTKREYPQLTHRQILQVLSGLLLAMFVSNVAGTVVANALPTISATLGSNQQQYTWIVTATLLASTASTPIWGKLADLFNKKTLLLVGLAIFILGSGLSGASHAIGGQAHATSFLIAFRAVQGIGLGAMMSLTQAIIGSIIPPIQRGRYMAYTGATIATATVVGPLVGGFIVDTPWLGWEWCFWSAVPFALLAGGVLQFRLKVPFRKRPNATVDWLGGALVTVAVSALLIWISFADHEFPYLSWQTAALLATTAVATGLFILVEHKAKNPIIPLALISMRTTALAIVASIAVGIGMFGASVFLGQYYQIARGYSPTQAGLMMLPMMIGMLLSSVFIGRLVSKLGIWKPFVLAGAIILVVGFGLMATVRAGTNLVLIGTYATVAGLGIGMTMQNLVLAVQNSVSVRDVGAASGAVTFFRSLGGAIGIQVLGVVFSRQVGEHIHQRLSAIPNLPAGVMTSSGQDASGMSLDLSALPAPAEAAVRGAYGDSIGLLFLIAAGVSLVSTVAVAFMTSTRLRDSFDTGASVDAK
ncbi:MAG: MFS transporter [Bifidobacteriaceae bacterium]|nr:MFS transporter [Bifidobacteriaceae bacterium]